MKITIQAETPLYFDIVLEREGKRVEGYLVLQGGQWMYSTGPQQGENWIADRRVDWPEALKRACEKLCEAMS